MDKYEIITKNKDLNTITFSIKGEFTIYTVSEMKKNFDKKIESHKSFHFLLKDVSKMDTAGFQLIVYMKREILNAEKEFKVIEMGTEVDKFFNFFNEIL